MNPVDINFVPSPNFGYPTGTKGQNDPIAFVCHVMEGSFLGTRDWFQNPKSQSSTHFGISREGLIDQYVEVRDAAYGNGKVEKASWALLRPGSNPNRYTISIEFEGKHPDASRGQFWAPTYAQIRAAAHLIATLAPQFNIPIDRQHVIGHYEIDAVSRANCPGPRFPFDYVIEMALEATVAATGEEPALPAVKVVDSRGNRLADGILYRDRSYLPLRAMADLTGVIILDFSQEGGENVVTVRLPGQ